MRPRHPVLEIINKRRSVRRYDATRPVEPEKTTILLEAAMAAPSACNIQPWEFIVITDAGKLKELRENIVEHGNYVVPLAIVVCGSSVFIPWENDFGEYDCCAAIENMLIAATSIGLGSVWIGGFKADTVRDALDIPETVKPVGIAYFGYPAEETESRTQYTAEAVHWQKYDRNRPHEPREGCLLGRKK